MWSDLKLVLEFKDIRSSLLVISSNPTGSFVGLPFANIRKLPDFLPCLVAIVDVWDDDGFDFVTDASHRVSAI